ncbi:uncharacterized protein LOC125683307 isoform X2 [Ostrea edulis]|uniref:uncharacterized protein LOC125683307 isoform X2 n=1 Tax=Ostrea edulis TaxID=37623 RepID=UPI0024AF368F|nr:uncharacterized protein LOC125683307 isoform X2 [Ostrea edulis]
MKEHEEIPFRFVGYEVWTQLANKLDPDTGLNGNNWRMLAEKLGYSTEVILCLESKKTSHGRNTLTLFEEYIKKRDSSVNAVIKALDSMERKDALEVLQNSLPEIERRYKADMKSMTLKQEPQEHNECSPCFHSFPNGSLPPSHHSSYPRYSVPYSHIAHRMNIVGPSHSNAYSNLEPDMPKKINTPSAYSTKHVVTQGMFRMGTNYQHSGTHTGMSTNVRGGSMAVQVDRSDNYTSDEIEMGELPSHAGRIRDDPQPLPAGIYRGQYMNSLSHVPNMVNSQDMAVASEEVVDTSPSFMETTVPQHGSLKRQNSVESNARQPVNEMHAKKAESNKKLALNIPTTFNRNHMQPMKPQDAFISPSPSQTPTSSQNPLDKLRQITGSNSYMPDEKYQSMIEEKNREEMLYNRSGSEEPFRKVPTSSCQYEADHRRGAGQQCGEWFNFKSCPRGNYQAANNLKLTKDGPSTFPLRSKSLTTCMGNEEDSQECSNLSKSQSMPHDMKPAEYRKAFRHIKVFVTYSTDSKRHIQKVLNLCRCIEKNGFTCCMDMYDRRMPTEDKLGWVKERFDEADFILICVSESYVNETERGQAESIESSTDKQLHTDYIYQLMVLEYNQIGRNRRFIPVMLDGTTEEHIPSWLQSTLFYKWPTHFRDLLWFLTKPETRIKTKTLTEQKSSEEEEMLPDSPPAAAAT